MSIGKKATLVSEDGNPTNLLRDVSSEELGACAFSSAGFVVSALSMSGDQPRSVLRFYDVRGTLTSTRKIMSESIPVASPTRPHYLISLDQGMALVDANGKELKTFPDARSGIYTPQGSLVLVEANGTVTWVKQ